MNYYVNLDENSYIRGGAVSSSSQPLTEITKEQFLSIPSDLYVKDVLRYKWEDGKVVDKKTTVETASVKDAYQKKIDMESLRSTDLGMARCVEDIINYIEDGTPLPKAAKDKVSARKALRAKL